ncbi:MULTISPECIES: hypothetical protein [Rhizobium/Agrobacterium group]|uniref:Uncharacterized protein n=2 Tax=Rhizobium TaxID=379 RepID=A0ABR5CNH3_9HYPH|nr:MULTISPECIES: hypothetical protein [Rhizobium/Agrobacterium group]KAA3503940.1 hypothetical protein DXM27_01120 [Rhizobium rhizogenes]KJF66388.1 hypothetical protein RS75_17545 [Rhizobium nepotum 39/7]CAH0131391.1 hypothetical protein SRABI05_00054 [Agrobacterium fabrum]CAH0150957.1 hypothetical protein SRABI46_00769 [Agrobacterium fabrum]
MRHYIRNRVAEAREHLQPVLKELGLNLMVSDRENQEEIYFAGKPIERFYGERLWSPVTIHFNRSITPAGRKEAQWEDAHLCIEDWRPKPLGRTGRVHRRWWGYKHLPVEKTGKEMFAWMEKTIRKHGAFIYGSDSGHVSSEELADTYWELFRERKIKDLDIVTIESERWNHDALTFQDHLGRRIHMVYAGVGELMIDGELVGTFNKRTPFKTRLAESLKTGSSWVKELYDPVVSGMNPR